MAKKRSGGCVYCGSPVSYDEACDDCNSRQWEEEHAMANSNPNINADLWSGNDLSPTNWPDIESALKVVQDELSDGVTNRQLWQIKRAHRWLKSVEEVLAENITAAER